MKGYALNPRRNKSIFRAEFFDNRALMIPVLRKTKNVQNIFTRKGKHHSIKKKRLCYFVFILFYLFHVCYLCQEIPISFTGAKDETFGNCPLFHFES